MPSYASTDYHADRRPTGAQPARPLTLIVLAARNLCLQAHGSAQENLELPRVHPLYRTGRIIRSRAARAENNLLPGYVDNPGGAQWSSNYIRSAHPERVVSHAWTLVQTICGFAGRARSDANIFSARR